MQQSYRSKFTNQRVPSKVNSMSHLGTSLLPMAALIAVPDTPAATPPPPLRKKNMFGKRKKTKPSPILPAMISAHKATTAVGLVYADEYDLERHEMAGGGNLFTDEMEEEFDSFIDQEDEVGYATVGRSNFTEDSSQNLKSPIEMTTVSPLGDAPDTAAVYTVVQKSSPKTPNSGEENPRQQQKSPSRSPNTSHFEERQKNLERRIKHQNDETKGIVIEMMKQQHKTSMKQDQVIKDLDSVANERDYLQKEREVLLQENKRLIQGNAKASSKDKHILLLAKLLKIEDIENESIIISRIQEIVEENEILKETVHRLNIELSRFQSKFGDVPSSKEATGLPNKGRRPPWLTDVRYLSPLFVSYDAQMAEKDDAITEYSVQLKELRQEVIKMSKENETLYKACDIVKAEPFVSQEKWDNMRGQNDLMAEEIQILIQQVKMAENKAKKFHQMHVTEVCELTNKVSVSETENEVFRDENKRLQKELNEFKQDYENLEIESSKKVPAANHVSTINTLKRDYEELKENFEYESKKMLKKIKDAEEEKKESVLQIAEHRSENKQLEGNVIALEKAVTKLRTQEENLRNEIYDYKEKMKEYEQHLADVIYVAEKASIEKEALSSLIEKEQQISHSTLQKSMREKIEMEQMERVLKEYQKESQNKLSNVSHTIDVLQENHESRLRESNREVTHLRHMLHEKQMKVDKVFEEKRMLEVQLENVWQAAANENKLIMSALYKSNLM